MSVEDVFCKKGQSAMLIKPFGSDASQENQRTIVEAGLNAFCKNNCTRGHCLAETMSIDGIGHEVANLITGTVTRIVS